MPTLQSMRTTSTPVINGDTSPSLSQYNPKYLPSWAKRRVSEENDGLWQERNNGLGQNNATNMHGSQSIMDNAKTQSMNRWIQRNQSNFEIGSPLSATGKPPTQPRPSLLSPTEGNSSRNFANVSSSSSVKGEEDLSTSDSEKAVPVENRGARKHNAINGNGRLLPSVSVPNINDIEESRLKISNGKAKSKYIKNPLNASRSHTGSEVPVKPRLDELNGDKNLCQMVLSAPSTPANGLRLPAMITKPPISRKREELSRAINEARKKLETVCSLCRFCMQTY